MKCKKQSELSLLYSSVPDNVIAMDWMHITITKWYFNFDQIWRLRWCRLVKLDHQADTNCIKHQCIHLIIHINWTNHFAANNMINLANLTPTALISGPRFPSTEGLMRRARHVKLFNYYNCALLWWWNKDKPFDQTSARRPRPKARQAARQAGGVEGGRGGRGGGGEHRPTDERPRNINHLTFNF